MAQYESEHSKFIREWMEKHPEEREEQRKGRAMWWDKPQTLSTLQANRESQIAQKPYYYQNEV